MYRVLPSIALLGTCVLTFNSMGMYQEPKSVGEEIFGAVFASSPPPPESEGFFTAASKWIFGKPEKVDISKLSLTKVYETLPPGTKLTCIGRLGKSTSVVVKGLDVHPIKLTPEDLEFFTRANKLGNCSFG